ncbi:MAG: pyridine nucleotide-disulfide oxidoreductase [unclassified Hahellaceae]|nr:pyridine nucleotide-disulfide oxidoreductase [Hahellaceae bacterium]
MSSSSSVKIRNIVIIAVIAALIGSFFIFDLGQYLTLDALSARQDALIDYYRDNTLAMLAGFFAVYVVVTALSIPGAAILTLAAGAIFGLWTGLVLVSFASSIGATIAFLISRLLLKDWVQKKFGRRLQTINKGVEKDGAFYLFSLRLVPAFPFFVINLVMGLTPIKTRTFYWVSQLGMLPGTAVYVNAGTQLASIESTSDILSPALIGSFLLLAIFPFIARFIVDFVKNRKMLSQYDKPGSFDYNVVVIGAGSGGLVASYIAAAVKAKVALIERHKMGGDCLNTGCVPSKALLRSAKIASYIRKSEDYGISAQAPEVDFAAVMDRIQSKITMIEPHDSIERYSQLGVDCVTGDARIVDPYRVQVGNQLLTCKNIVVATGGRPFVPPIPGLDSATYYTSDTIWGLRRKPEHLLIVGGGPIGCELSQAFVRLGIKVTQIDRDPRLLPREDDDAAKLVMAALEADGARLILGANAKSVRQGGSAYADSQILTYEQGGEEHEIEFDTLLLAVGRAANSRGFGLEEIGVRIEDNGTLEVNEYLQTSVPNIYACGDVAGPYQFTHVASHQAWYASVNALFGFAKRFKADYRVIPWATFTDPEVARVGLSENEAKAQGIEYEVTRYGIDDLDRAIADGEDHGFVKVLTEPGKDTILGVTIVGYHAADLITEYIAAMKHKIGLNKILGTIHIYPTMSEANKMAAGQWKRAHAPEKLLAWVEKFHTWRRH